MDNNIDNAKYYAKMFFERGDEQIFALEAWGKVEKHQLLPHGFKFADWQIIDPNGETPDINGDIGKCLDLVPYILKCAESTVLNLPPHLLDKDGFPCLITKLILGNGDISFGIKIYSSKKE